MKLHPTVAFFWAVLFLAPTSSSVSEVLMDSGNTTGVAGPGAALTGPNFVVPFDPASNIGTKVGPNLFQSFWTLTINNNETLTFTGPSDISNVIARVTGPSSTLIDGALGTTIPAANLWLINPQGIKFGEHATFDPNAAFKSVHVGTADYMRLGNGGIFSASSPGSSVLTTAPPEAFGFLVKPTSGGTSNSVAGVGFFHSSLSIPRGGDLTIIAGDVLSDGATFSAPNGHLTIASVGSAGELSTHSGYTDVSQFNRLGDIQLINHSDLSASSSDSGGGTVSVRSNSLVVNNSIVESIGSRTDSAELGIDIITRGDFDILNTSELTTSTVRTRSGNIRLSSASGITIGQDSEVSTLSSRGASGSITLDAQTVAMSSGSHVNSTTASGSAGSISISAAHSIIATGRSQTDSSSRTSIASSSASGTSAAGDITLTSPDIRIENGALVQATSGGSGHSGNINLQHVSQLHVATGGQINNSANGVGNGGNIYVDATGGSVVVEGKGSGISNQNSGSSTASRFTKITAGAVVVDNSGAISSSTVGRGSGGDIEISASRIGVSHDGRITSESTASKLSSGLPGISGTIVLNASDSLELSSGGSVSVQTAVANAGNIQINAGRLVHLRSASITTSAASGNGNGGNIVIDPTFVVLDSGSKILAQAQRGAGGNIRISSDFFFQSLDSKVDASSELGINGTVNISATDADVVSGTLALPESFLQAGNQLNSVCARRVAGGISSFVVTGRQGMAASPDAFQRAGPSMATIASVGAPAQQKSLDTAASNQLEPYFADSDNSECL